MELIKIKIIFFMVIVASAFICLLDAYAAPYYEEHEKGWHWYDDPKEKEQEEQQKRDPVSQIKALKEEMEQSLDKAILDPTVENVANYIELQNASSNRASKFALAWQKTLLVHPELDYSIDHPTNNLAKQVYLDTYSAKEKEAVANLAKHSGLFFFYKSSCPYCQKFAPIVKNFSVNFGIPIIPITLDGKALSEFPETVLDKGQAAKFNVTATPALFAVDPYSKKAYPVAYGFISESDLKKRILDVATDFKER